jgi:prophage antirepressor-like protein
MSDIVIYNNGELDLKVSLNEDTIWLTQKQIATLFGKDVRTINDHIKAIYKDKELLEKSTIRNFRIVQKEGNREVSREVKHYNLDMIISVGYRVNSKEATKFRQWATSILKEYIFNGYAINREKITQQRLSKLEDDVNIIKKQIKNNTLEVKQGIFFDGETFDAYEFVSNLIKKAQKSIKLIDNYIDETVLTLFSKNQKISVTIYTKNFSKQLKLDLKKYNSQYKQIKIKKFDNSHDRFLIIDDIELYHFGASLKDLGKKWFAFSKMDIKNTNILERLS